MPNFVIRAATRRASLRNSSPFLNSLIAAESPEDPRQAVRTTIERLTKAWAIAESQNESFLYPTPAFPNVSTGPELQNLMADLTPQLWMVEREVADMTVKLQLREIFSCMRAESHIVGLCEVHLATLKTLMEQLEKCQSGHILHGDFSDLTSIDLENGIDRVKRSLHHLIGRSKIEGVSESPVLQQAIQILGVDTSSLKPTLFQENPVSFDGYPVQYGSKSRHSDRTQTRKGSMKSLEFAFVPPSDSDSEDSPGLTSPPESRRVSQSSYTSADSIGGARSSRASNSSGQTRNDAWRKESKTAPYKDRVPALPFVSDTVSSSRTNAFIRTGRRSSRCGRLLSPEKTLTGGDPLVELSKLRSVAVLSGDLSGTSPETTLRSTYDTRRQPTPSDASAALANDSVTSERGASISTAFRSMRFASAPAVPPIPLNIQSVTPDYLTGKVLRKNETMGIPGLHTRRSSQDNASRHSERTVHGEHQADGQHLSGESSELVQPPAKPDRRRRAGDKEESSSSVDRYAGKRYTIPKKPKNNPHFPPIGYIRADGYFESCTSETATGFSSSDNESTPSTSTRRIPKISPIKETGRVSPFGWSFNGCPGSGTRGKTMSVRSPVETSSFVSSWPCNPNAPQALSEDAMLLPATDRKPRTASHSRFRDSRFTSRQSPRHGGFRRPLIREIDRSLARHNSQPAESQLLNSSDEASPIESDMQLNRLNSFGYQSETATTREPETTEKDKNHTERKPIDSDHLQNIREARRTSLMSLLNGKTSKYYNRGDALYRFIDEVNIDDVASTEEEKNAHRKSLTEMNALHLPRRESVPEEVVASLTRHLKNQRRVHKAVAASKQRKGGSSGGLFDCCWHPEMNEETKAIQSARPVPSVFVNGISHDPSPGRQRSISMSSANTTCLGSSVDASHRSGVATVPKYTMRSPRRHTSVESEKKSERSTARSKASDISSYSDTESKNRRKVSEASVSRPDVSLINPVVRSQTIHTDALRSDAILFNKRHPSLVKSIFSKHSTNIHSTHGRVPERSLGFLDAVEFQYTERAVCAS